MSWPELGAGTTLAKCRYCTWVILCFRHTGACCYSNGRRKTRNEAKVCFSTMLPLFSLRWLNSFCVNNVGAKWGPGDTAGQVLKLTVVSVYFVKAKKRRKMFRKFVAPSFPRHQRFFVVSSKTNWEHVISRHWGMYSYPFWDILFNPYCFHDRPRRNCGSLLCISHRRPSQKTPWKLTNLEQYLISLVLYTLRLSQPLWVSSLWFKLAMGWVAWIRSLPFEHLFFILAITSLYFSYVHEWWHPKSNNMLHQFQDNSRHLSTQFFQNSLGQTPRDHFPHFPSVSLGSCVARGIPRCHGMQRSSSGWMEGGHDGSGASWYGNTPTIATNMRRSYLLFDVICIYIYVLYREEFNRNMNWIDYNGLTLQRHLNNRWYTYL